MSEFEAGERMIRKNTRDRALIFIGSGTFTAFKETQNQIYGDGAVLGIMEFMHNSPWQDDIICNKGGYVFKLKHESLLDLQ